jgi:hypothetical protein
MKTILFNRTGHLYFRSFVGFFCIPIIAACLTILGSYLTARAEDNHPTEIVVQAGDKGCFNAPVSLDLSDFPFNEDRGRFILFETTSRMRRETPCQLESYANPRLWWILSGDTGAGRKRTYELTQAGPAARAPAVTCVLDDRALTILCSGRNVLQYIHGLAEVPQGVDPVFRRSGFIHPLWSPSGFALTNIQPADHRHHYGIWNPWTRTLFQGREVDFWNLGDRKGTVRFAGFLSNTEGPVFGGFKALQEHLDLSINSVEKTALHEVWDVLVWNTADTTHEPFLVDFTTVLSCAGPDSVQLEAYLYGGGIGFRATDQWTAANADVLTSEGRTRPDADGSEARWCRVSGASGAETRAGIVFMSHPSNRAHPEPMRVWPADANNGRGDLFFEFCPIRLKPWTLVPGREYVLRYRMLVYDGETAPADCERAWRDFAFPPRAWIR